jgi:hypothetical protein
MLYPIIYEEISESEASFISDGATHVARVLVGTMGVELVDGADIYFTIISGTLLIISELDTPACSGPFEWTGLCTVLENTY